MKKITFKQLEKEFAQFLIENNAYKAYIKAFNQQYHPSKETEKLIALINPLKTRKIQDEINDSGGKYLVDASFTWSMTTEGHDFWEELNELWAEKMTKTKIINK